MTGMPLFYHYEHVLNLIGGKIVVTDIINFINRDAMKCQDDVRKCQAYLGFITVIVVGLVNPKWILMINTSCSVVSFWMIRNIVDSYVSSHELV